MRNHVSRMVSVMHLSGMMILAVAVLRVRT